MFKLLVFTIFLFSSSAFGLLDDLLRAERNCYSGCNSNYMTSVSNMEACKTGCNYKLQNENCPDQCKSLSTDEQIQASCLVGCSMFQSEMKKPVQNDRQQSIILARLRQVPPVQVSSANADNAKTLHDMMIKLKENARISGTSQGLSNLGDSKQTLSFSEVVPLSKLPAEVRSQLTNTGNANVVTHLVIYQEDEIDWLHDRLQNTFSYIRDKWNVLFGKQSAVAIFLIHLIFLFLSTTLCYMIVSLCRHAPTRHVLSIQAQELAFDDVFEKEKLQSNSMIQLSPVQIK